MPLLARPLPLRQRAAATVEPPAVPPIEAALVRRSVGALSAGITRCHHCHRAPLVGECAYLYGEQVVCELCRPLRRRAPDSAALVRSSEHERAVRPIGAGARAA